MKYIRILLTVVLGVIYIPLNTLNSSVKKWYFRVKKEDEVVYYLFTPIYWILVIVTTIISIPYEAIATDLH